MALIPRILDLCAGSGAWSQPYVDSGYEVIRVTLPEQDVRLFRPPDQVHGILAAPPCTVFASSGARWPRTDQDYIEALSIVDACLRLVIVCQPQWWCLENPVGKLVRWLGPPVAYFNPCDYGDPWTKKTALWGDFIMPPKTPVEPICGSKIHRYPPSPDRGDLRSITPPAFSRAFFEANP